MTIKNDKKFGEAAPAGFDGIFDWDFLLPAFAGTKIEPMDIDAIVERHGRILIFETKTPGFTIPLGQEITLKTLLRLGKGCIHLMVLYGKTKGEIVKMEEWCYAKGQIKTKETDCDADHVLQRVTAWFNWANSKGDY